MLLTHCMRRPGGADWHSLPSTDCQSPRCKKRESELTNHSSHNHNHLLPTIQSAKPFEPKRKMEKGKEEKKTRLKMNKTETPRNDIALPPISQMMEVHDDLR